MEAVLLVDAAPGFEDALEGSVRKLPVVRAVTRVKERNFDLAILIEVDDEAHFQRFLAGQLRMQNGVKGWERLAAPSGDLMKRLGR